MPTRATITDLAGNFPGILRLAFIALIVASAGLARAQNANQLRQEMTQRQQMIQLTQQISQLQLQSINLTIQIASLTKQLPPEPPKAPAAQIGQPAESPELADAALSVEEAKAACDALKQKLLAAVHGSAEYKQAQDARESARTELDQTKSAHAGPDHDVIVLARQALAAETLMARLEKQALDSSPDWKPANDKLQEANKALAGIRADLAQAAKKNADPPGAQGPVDMTTIPAQIRNLTAQRDKLDARAKPLMQELTRLSPQAAQLVLQEGEGVREELTQLQAQQQLQNGMAKSAAGAPLIHFSPQVSPRVQQLLQGNLDEQERMKNPAYAAKKRQEAQDAAQRQQQQLAQMQQQGQDQQQAQQQQQQQQADQQAQQQQRDQQQQQQQADDHARAQQEQADQQAQQQQQQQQADQQAQQQQQQQADQQAQQQQAAQQQQQQQAAEQARVAGEQAERKR